MIEGIVGLLIILGIMLLVPYIKEWYQRIYSPEDIVKIEVTQNGWTQTRRDGVTIHHATEKTSEPKQGDIWIDKDDQTYKWNSGQWEPVNPKPGDLWFH